MVTQQPDIYSIPTVYRIFKITTDLSEGICLLTDGTLNKASVNMPFTNLSIEITPSQFIKSRLHIKSVFWTRQKFSQKKKEVETTSPECAHLS